MKRILIVLTFFLLNLILIGQSWADIEQPYSNTYLSINYYDIGQSFTAEITGYGYANIYAWVDPDWGTGDVGITLKSGNTVLTSGTSSVGTDGMVSLDVSGVSFTSGISYDFYLTSSTRFAKVYWEEYGSIGDAYVGGQLITIQGYVEQGSYGNQPLSEYDLAFAVSDAPIIPLCEGNFDHDSDVDGSDLAVFAADFGRTNCNGNCQGDFDGDNDVDGSDLATFAADFGRTDCPIIP